MSFFRACVKEAVALIFLILGLSFCPQKDKRFCPASVLRKGMSNAVQDFVLYLLSQGLKIS